MLFAKTPFLLFNRLNPEYSGCKTNCLILIFHISVVAAARVEVAAVVVVTMAVVLVSPLTLYRTSASSISLRLETHFIRK